MIAHLRGSGMGCHWCWGDGRSKGRYDLEYHVIKLAVGRRASTFPGNCIYQHMASVWYPLAMSPGHPHPQNRKEDCSTSTRTREHAETVRWRPTSDMMCLPSRLQLASRIAASTLGYNTGFTSGWGCTLVPPPQPGIRHESNDMRRSQRMSGSLLLSAGWSTASSPTQSAMRSAATAQPTGAYSASAGAHRGTCRDPNRSAGSNASLRRNG